MLCVIHYVELPFNIHTYSHLSFNQLVDTA